MTGEGTPEEKLVVLLQKNVEQQEEIAAVRKEASELSHIRFSLVFAEDLYWGNCCIMMTVGFWITIDSQFL